MKILKAMMAVQKFLFLLSLFALASCSLFQGSSNSVVDELLVTPTEEGHKAFLSAIYNAKKSIWMKMFHLSDESVTKALIEAHQKHVDVKIILDYASLNNKKFAMAYNDLRSAGVDVRPSSPCFSITHEKSMIIDSKKSFITAINLTKAYKTTRDFGIVTYNKDIVSEMVSVFKTDLDNAKTAECKTPELHQKNLIWSPVNSETRLVDLIKSARNSVFVQIENLGNKRVEDALIEAAGRGVETKVIVPQCDRNKNPLYNYPLMNLLKMGGVDVRVMPYPESKDHPYMHSKMVLVDEAMAYIGSANFSNNSLLKARELGIIFVDEKPIETLGSEFKKDWFVAIAPVLLKNDFCPVLD